MNYNIINDIKCVSLKEYGEFKQVSPSRMTQLKESLPIVEFDGISQAFVNLSELDLSEQVRAAADQVFYERQQLHTLTNGQLGQYFQAFIARLLNQASQAEQLRLQDELRIAELKALLEASEQQLEALTSELEDKEQLLEQHVQKLDLLSQKGQAVDARLVEQLDRLKVENDELVAENKGLRFAIYSIRDDLKKPLESKGSQAETTLEVSAQKAKKAKSTRRQAL